ncbi:hypothetical protein PSE10B_52540 [Pseudomonas amygdali pv. eriobotryae]|nr:hypothetical protein PSE10B_52540 [Pseudomonas amygdali pv. eriobotryae]
MMVIPLIKPARDGELRAHHGVDFLFHINGDMSERVMSIIESMVPATEVYSIDKNKLHTVDAQS